MDKIKELKAQAYDCITQIELWQGRLRGINNQIMEFSKPVETKAE